MEAVSNGIEIASIYYFLTVYYLYMKGDKKILSVDYKEKGDLYIMNDDNIFDFDKEIEKDIEDKPLEQILAGIINSQSQAQRDELSRIRKRVGAMRRAYQKMVFALCVAIIMAIIAIGVIVHQNIKLNNMISELTAITETQTDNSPEAEKEPLLADSTSDIQPPLFSLAPDLVTESLNLSTDRYPSLSSIAFTQAINTVDTVLTPPTPPEVEETLPPIPERVINLTDIAKPSNLTSDELNNIIDTRLQDIGISSSKFNDMGEALAAMEKETNVNALFCLAIGSLESGHGTSSLANRSNNLFGLIANSGPMSFSTVEKCVTYWGSLIRDNYIDTGRDTIAKIQSKYCPGSTKWTKDVTWFFNLYGSLYEVK